MTFVPFHSAQAASCCKFIDCSGLWVGLCPVLGTAANGIWAQFECRLRAFHQQLAFPFLELCLLNQISVVHT